MRHLALIYCILSITNCISQSDYFSIYQPHDAWIQTGGGGVQIEATNFGYTIACTPIEESQYGFGILNLNFDGGFLSSLFYETNGLSQNNADAFIKYNDGSSIYAGDRENNQWVVKFDQNDSILWEHIFPYNFSEDELFTGFIEDEDGYVFGGRLTNEQGIDNSIVLFKTTLEGESLYLNYINPNELGRFVVDDFLSVNEVDIILSISDNMNDQRALVKVNTDGTFDDNSSSYFFFNQESVIQNVAQVVLSQNGNVVVAYTKGDEESWGGGNDFINYRFSILELNPETMQPVQDEIIYDDLYLDHDISDFVQTPDGGYAILGNDFGSWPIRGFIKKLSPNFEEEWMVYYNHELPDSAGGILDDFEITEDGGFICAGTTSSVGNPNYLPNLWLLKLDACGDTEWQGCTSSVSELGVNGFEFSIYPNPSQDILTLELDQITFGQNLTASLRNTLGQEVFTQDIYAAHSELDVSKLPSGVYVLSLVSDGRELSSRRVVIE